MVAISFTSTQNYDLVISMLDHHHPDNWRRFWPLDGEAYIREMVSKFVANKIGANHFEATYVTTQLLRHVIDMKPGDEAVLIFNDGFELYII